MKELENFTLQQIANYISNKIAEDFDVNKSLAKKLLINALTYNVVIEEIENQVDFLLNFNN